MHLTPAVKKFIRTPEMKLAALEEMGYSEETWQNKKLTFKDFAEKCSYVISDELLIRKLAEGLEATKIVTSPTEEDNIVPDYKERRESTKLVLQVTGKIGPDVLVVPPASHTLPQFDEEQAVKLRALIANKVIVDGSVISPDAQE